MSLPETRNSHLAGVLERKKAKKRLARLRRKQRKESRTMTPTTNGKSNGVHAHAAPPQVNDSSRGVSTTQSTAAPPKPRRRRSGLGAPLPSDVRDHLLGEHGRLGHDGFLERLSRFDPDRNRNSNGANVRKLLRAPDARWSSTMLSVWTRFSAHLRGGVQAALPLPMTNSRIAATPRVQAPPVQQSMQPDALVRLFQETISQTLATGFSMLVPLLSQQHAAPQLPPPASPPPAAPPSSSARGDAFSALPNQQKRKAIKMRVDRYVPILQAELGFTDGAHPAAWDLFYDEYALRAGVDVKALKSESAALGADSSVLDVVESRGELDLLWRVIRDIAG